MNALCPTANRAVGAPGPTGNSEPASEFMIEKTEGGELNC